MSPTLKSTGVRWITEAKFGEKGLDPCSQILARSGTDMGLSYAKEIVSISSAV